eukprot:COSAG04_NODE_3918_length_2424_cov_3.585806_3_plen_107_part_00
MRCSEIGLRLVCMLCAPSIASAGGWQEGDAPAAMLPELRTFQVRPHQPATLCYAQRLCVTVQRARQQEKALGGLERWGLSPSFVERLLQRLLLQIVPLGDDHTAAC